MGSQALPWRHCICNQTNDLGMEIVKGQGGRDEGREESDQGIGRPVQLRPSPGQPFQETCLTASAS